MTDAMIRSPAMYRRAGRASRASRSCLALALSVAPFGLVAAASAGCGPIGYVSEVTRRASTAVDQARAAHADKYAPYWWTRATQYLHKARELAAHADFQAANRYGRVATEAATQATEEATIAANAASPSPAEPARAAQPAPAAPVAPASRPSPVAPPAKQPAAPAVPEPRRRAPAAKDGS